VNVAIGQDACGPRQFEVHPTIPMDLYGFGTATCTAISDGTAYDPSNVVPETMFQAVTRTVQ
jgi:hypothetical protein